MKLLIVSHSCASPINRRLYAYVQQETNWDITLVVPSNWKNEYGKKLIGETPPDSAYRLVQIPVWKSGNIILHAYRCSFGRLLNNLRPDAIYVNHEPYAVATAQVFLANHRTIRKPIGFYSCQNIYKKYPPPFRWTEAMVLRRSRFFFPISKDVEEVFRRKGYNGASAVLPLGIDPETYYPRGDAGQVREEIGVAPGQMLIGYVGRIVREKGLMTLLSALDQIRDLPWRLLMAGAGPMEAEFDAQARAMNLADRITRIGFVPHEAAPRYLSALDVLVLPSETQPNWKEQFGRVLLESMACGVPVVGSDSGEIPTLIRETGGGLVFPERDPGGLADRLASLIRDQQMRTKLAAAGRQSVNDYYELPALARKFSQAILRGIAAK